MFCGVECDSSMGYILSSTAFECNSLKTLSINHIMRHERFLEIKVISPMRFFQM